MPGQAEQWACQSGAGGGRWWILVSVPAPRPADAPEVRAATLRMMKWLIGNGHTEAKTVSEVFVNSLRSPIPHPKGSLPYVVTRALMSAFAASSLVKRAPIMHAIAEIHHLRSKAAALTRTLSEVDTLMARENFLAANPTFAECGNDVIAAIEFAAGRLEKLRGVDAPTTKSAWKSFVGRTATALLKAGMPLNEIAALFPQRGDPEHVRERLRRQTSRRAAQKAAKGSRRRK